jgi:hypothetical protein
MLTDKIWNGKIKEYKRNFWILILGPFILVVVSIVLI